MRLGAHIFEKLEGPEHWAQTVRGHGYGAAYCPVGPATPADIIAAYAAAACEADIVIAEVGTWSNPISPDAAEANAALDKCKAGLALADEIGARCCVNIAGSFGRKWDGPDRRNLSQECFDRIVETTREIIDAVKPKRTFYALETMPWIFPHTPQAYLDLVRAIDRPQLGVHLDPVNMVNGVVPYFENAALLRESFEKLGPWIKSAHAKDIVLRETLTTHLDEVRPGLGALDYGVYLTELAKLEQDVPLMIEHLSEEDYPLAADHIRSVAAQVGVQFS
jgi:sugar phosphate isomerase/epimerase